MKSNNKYKLEIAALGIESLEPYKGSKTKILHQCKQGHLWYAKPEHILSGRGCSKCNNHNFNRRKTDDEYNLQLLEREIDYWPIEPYILDNIKIDHECINGHIWKVAPNDILKGKGCPQCCNYSFDITKPAILYFISFSFNNNTYYKLGVTNRTVKDRFGSEMQSLTIKSLWTLYFDKGKDALFKEKELLNKYKDYKVNCGALKRGNTETLSIYISQHKAMPASLE